MSRRFPAWALVPCVAAALTACSVLQGTEVGSLTQRLQEEGAKAPLLSRFIETQPAITTSIADARTELPLLDRYEPDHLEPLDGLPRAPAGGFLLRPGAFEMTAQSYCLHAGTYGPTQGDGYLLAPLQGPAAPSIRHILQNSARAPELEQRDIQALIWAILSHAKIENLEPRLQAVAVRLLSPAEVATLNRTGLDLIPSSMKAEAVSRLPAPARAVFEAEAELREMFTRTQASYEELERTAVLAGLAPPGPGSREVARGRWSFHPGGFFVRYFPEGYNTTRVQVLVPEPVTVRRDRLGRITSLANARGDRVETVYDDKQPALVFPGTPGLKGHAFRSVRVVRRRVAPPEIVVKIEQRWPRGWVLLGIPSASAVAPAASNRFPDAGARASWAVEQAALLERLSQEVRQAPPAPEALEEAVALAEYAQALEQLTAGQETQDEGLGSPASLAQSAWLHAVCRGLGGCGAQTAQQERVPPRALLASVSALVPASAVAQAPGAAAPSSGGQGFDPSGHVATPGNTGTQRLAQSERPKDKERHKDCGRAQKDRDEAQKLRDAYGSEELKQRAREKNWSVEQFKDAANQQVFGPQAQEGGSGKEGNFESPMWTNPTTCNINENWDRARYEREGYGEVNYEADRVHEQTHERHCRSYRNPMEYNAKLSDPAGLSDDEAAAYQAKIDYLDQWMGTHCP